MDPTLLFLILAVSIGLTVAAVLLVARDLLFPRVSEIDERLAGKLGKLSPWMTGTASAFLHNGDSAPWLDRITAENGFAFAPRASLGAALLAGGLTGAGFYMWRDSLLAAAAGALLGLVAVFMLTRWGQAWRRQAILTQLPEAMELLARATHAGKSLDQAMEMVGETLSGSLAREFRRCAQQLAMGLSVDLAMQNLTRRAPMAETRILAATLAVQRRSGGHLPSTLERLARVFRERLSCHRQFRAATAATRTGATVVAAVALLVTAYAILWQAEYARMALESVTGRTLLGTALCLEVVGLTWLSLLFRSEY